MIIKIVGLVILEVVVTYNQIIDLLGIIVEFVRLVIVIPNRSQTYVSNINNYINFVPNQLQGIPKNQKSYFCILKDFRYNHLFIWNIHIIS